jgi:RNA polymerase sigma-70 factor, ECF subfamily
MSNHLSQEEIFDRYFDEVYIYAAYLMSPDREEARDLTQEVFLAAFTALGKFRGECSMLSWLRGIARNKVSSHFRSLASRRNELSVSKDKLTEIAAVTPEATMSEDVSRVVRISQVMRTLPENYSELLEQKYLEGSTVRAMAEQRQQSEEAVESALARARAAFRSEWLRKFGRDMETSFINKRSSIHERK